MAYPRHLLNDGEEIVLDRNPHWAYLVGAAVMFCFGVIAFIAIATWVTNFWWGGLMVLVLVAIGCVGRYLRWRTTEFVVTTDRIITRQGILSKGGMEIPLDRVTNIAYHQAFWERILGTGDLLIESAGENGSEPFSNVANPSNVQNIIYRQSELYQGRRPAGPATDGSAQRGSGSMSVAEQLEKLANLNERGVLSDEEFDQQKRMLLEPM